MEQLQLWLVSIRDAVWSAPMLCLLFGVGLYLTFILRAVQLRYLGYAIGQVFSSNKASDAKGDISNFQALMTALAGAIGTGSIAGVATGLAIGGMGSLFWMWVTALVGMATKYAEGVLAIKYRVFDDRGEVLGGPMEYISRGLGWTKMAALFALFGILASIGTGNLVQVNSIGDALQTTFGVNPWVTGGSLALLTAVVLLGGVQSISRVASVIVPFMALFYICGGLFVLFLHADKIGAALVLIVKSAFTGQAAVGGFAGATMVAALQNGVARSIFSNEAGLGISSIAAAAAKSDYPGRQGMIAMTGALLSTVIVCTITGLVIAVTGVLGVTSAEGRLLSGASLAIYAFSSALPFGGLIVTLSTILFAYSTVLAWGYYGEKCSEYLWGTKIVRPFRLLFTLLVIPGAALDLEMVWYIADIANGLMAIPNLLAIAALSGVIAFETKEFLRVVAREKKGL